MWPVSMASTLDLYTQNSNKTESTIAMVRWEPESVICCMFSKNICHLHLNYEKERFNKKENLFLRMFVC